MTPDTGGPLDLPDLIAAVEREPDQLLARVERLKAERDEARALFLGLLRSDDATWAERNAAEARADKLHREVHRLWMRCYLLAGLAVFGWATVAGLLLSS